MARIPFGTTWWGKKWLDSLTLLDYENRLPRGRSYFSTGHVLSSEFDPKELLFTAKVQGSQLRPYTVKIRFPRVDREAAARFTDLVAKDPEFISSLVDDRLEPRVADVAEAAGLRLFRNPGANSVSPAPARISRCPVSTLRQPSLPSSEKLMPIP